eukprot:SAG22_NODE_2463_length_2541_cov_1.276003_1_plen_236_part_00
MSTLAAVAGVPAAALAHANLSGPKPLDSYDMSPLLFGDGSGSSCGADRLASPRTSLMYFYGDDHNGAYSSGDYKLVMGIDHKFGLWEQQWCLAATYSWPNRTAFYQDGQCDNPPGPAPCPSAKPCLFDVVTDFMEQHDLSVAQPERLATMLAQYRKIGETDCWVTDPARGCQSWTTAAQERWVGLSPLPCLCLFCPATTFNTVNSFWQSAERADKQDAVERADRARADMSLVGLV